MLNKLNPFYLVQRILAISFFFILTILLAPILIFLFVIEKISKLFKQSKPTNLMTPQRLNKNHLEEKLNIDDIEAREFVYDPLNAVPHLPFGFHNSSWLKFKFKLTEDDELWSFSAILNNEYGHPHKKRGYAILRESKIQSCFYTVNYRLSKQHLITLQNDTE